MQRMNLYNYRAEELYYAKLRLYFLFCIGIVGSLSLNLFIYLFYQFKIRAQQQLNAYLQVKIESLDQQNLPLKQFSHNLDIVIKRLDNLQQLLHRAQQSVRFFQTLNQLVPTQIYFTSIDIRSNQANFIGVSTSPLYVADFLKNLRSSADVFSSSTLISNQINQDGSNMFAIEAQLQDNLSAGTNHEPN